MRVYAGNCDGNAAVDTGGIIDDAWTDVEWVKITWMIDALGLLPWYKLATNSSYKAPPPPPIVRCAAIQLHQA